MLFRFLSNRVLCHVSFSLHRLLDESCIQLAASLLDSADKPTKVRISAADDPSLSQLVFTKILLDESA